MEAGTVDAGIVYRTDVQASADAVIAYAVPLEKGPTIVYPAAVVRDAPNEAVAARFLDYLRSAGARRQFEAAGFIGLSAAGQSAPETVR